VDKRLRKRGGWALDFSWRDIVDLADLAASDPEVAYRPIGPGSERHAPRDPGAVTIWRNHGLFVPRPQRLRPQKKAAGGEPAAESQGGNADDTRGNGDRIDHGRTELNGVRKPRRV
jgi:hypothetical protein